MASKATSYSKGQRAEFWAQIYFFFKGYKILKRRYKTKVGEVDLILRKRKSLVFVEVKLRQNIDDALYSIHFKNQNRVSRAAENFIMEHPQFSDYEQRFDVIAIVMRGRFLPNGFEHLDNAWNRHT